jgi:prepilin-type N-terminal cleavage/methylation domain-containing protein
MYKRPVFGFSLVELLVVISIIGILAGIVYASVSGMGAKGRNADRQADLRNLQIAIEKYKDKNGRYPAMGCPVGTDGLSGENDCSQYISGLTPDFISALPHDKNRGTNTGYAYITNTVAGNTGTVYKVLAVNSVESEVVTASHKLMSCDTTVDICNSSCTGGATRFAKTYALWGGYADASTDIAVKVATASIICR